MDRDRLPLETGVLLLAPAHLGARPLLVAGDGEPARAVDVAIQAKELKSALTNAKNLGETLAPEILIKLAILGVILDSKIVCLGRCILCKVILFRLLTRFERLDFLLIKKLINFSVYGF